MESLSPKQVREIKDLYENVYKEEVVEEVGDFDDLFESEEFQSLSDELKENIVKKMQDSLAKSEKSGVLGQLERLRRKAFGSEKERTQAINFEKNKNIIDKQKKNIPDEEKNKIEMDLLMNLECEEEKLRLYDEFSRQKVLFRRPDDYMKSIVRHSLGHRGALSVHSYMLSRLTSHP